MADEPNNHTDERDYTTGRTPMGQFGKGWAGGPGRPQGSKNKITKAMQDLILGSMDRRGGKILTESKEDIQPREAWMDSLDNNTFAKLVEKLLPRELILEGDDDGGPVRMNIIHYDGHKPDESEADTPDEETDDG